MVDSIVSGILFTRDPNTGENHMIIEAGWGLGEAIVGGEVTPDHYVVDGVTQKIVHKQISEQRMRIVRAEGGGNRREEIPAGRRARARSSRTTASRASSRSPGSSNPTTAGRWTSSGARTPTPSTSSRPVP